LSTIKFLAVILLASLAVILDADNAAAWGFLGMAIGYAVGKKK